MGLPSKASAKPRYFNFIRTLVSILLFSLALWVLHRELKDYHLRDIIHNFRQLPPHRLLTATGFTILSYVTLTCYDALGLKYIRRPLPYRKISVASFIAYAFSNNLGMSVITGGSVRYRLYSAWGLSTLDVSRVVAFCVLTFWLGFFALGGAAFLFEPTLLSQSIHIPYAAILTIGAFFVALTAIYLSLCVLMKRPLKIREWDFSLPGPSLALAQTLVGLLDWTLAASVLYSLLPPAPGLTFPGLLGIFLLAQLTGLASQIPGGVGVFESVVLLFLPPNFASSDAAALLLAYRILYYLTPLGTAAILLGSLEFFQQRRLVQRYAQAAGRQIALIATPVFSLATFVAGTLLLFYGALPVSGPRLEWLENVVPLPIFEISHFLGSVIGMALLILARGLQLRLDAAYFLTIMVLGFGVAFSLVGGFHYHQALALLILMAILLPSRRYFYRKTSLLSEPFNTQWIAAIIIVVLSSLWLGAFSYKHIEYSASLWWRFTFSENAPRFLRASVGAIGFGLFFSILKLFGPGRPKPVTLQQDSLEIIKAAVSHSPKTYANLALLGDKYFLFNETKTAFIMYGVEGRSWIALGDPVGPASELAELAWRFLEISDRYSGWSVFYQVDPENLPVYLDMGLTLLKLGEEGRVRLRDFSLDGSAHKGMRYAKNKLEKEGVTFDIIPPEEVPPLLPALKEVSDAWLAEKHTREKRFSLGCFNEEYLKMTPAAVVRSKEKIIAFANVLQGAEKEEVSVDLMRYLPGSSENLMEYLFIRLMLWGKQEGYQWFNLGMAPLSGLEARTLAPLWMRFGSLLYRHSEHFYNLQGLRQYKEKFNPEWRPKYLASPGGLALPRILTNVASLISGGFTGIVRR